MKRLVIIIPAYNEEDSIAQVIKKIPSVVKGIDDINVVVINDGSTDATAKIAKANGAKVVSHPQNFGLGVAFRRGITRALELGADIIVNIDADGQFNPQDIPKIIDPIIEGKAEFVTASRFIKKNPEFRFIFFQKGRKQVDVLDYQPNRRKKVL